MAGLLGEGGIGSLSGTASSASPVTIADFTPGGSGGGVASNGVDGAPCNVYGIRNNDTTGTLVVNVAVKGLHAGTKAYPVMAGTEILFKLGDEGNGIRVVEGWTSTTAGATTNSTTTVSGGVVSRLD